MTAGRPCTAGGLDLDPWLTESTTASSVSHKQKQRARGTLVNARTVGDLRLAGRWGAPAGTCAASLMVAVALTATPAYAASPPNPDPYRGKAPAPTPKADPPSVAPDPAPAAPERSSPPAASVSPPPPAPAPPPPPAPMVQAPKVVQTPKPRTRQASPPPPVQSGPSRPRVQLASTPASERPTVAVAAVVSPEDESRRHLLLAALALLALALSSGSLLHLMSHTGWLWRKA